MTAQQAADGEVEAFEGAVLEDGLTGVLAACGCEAAGGWGERRDAFLVEEDG